MVIVARKFFVFCLRFPIAQAKASAEKDDPAAHKADSVKWLADLASLNGDMDRKLTESPFYVLASPNQDFRGSSFRCGQDWRIGSAQDCRDTRFQLS